MLEVFIINVVILYLCGNCYIKCSGKHKCFYINIWARWEFWSKKCIWQFKMICVSFPKRTAQKVLNLFCRCVCKQKQSIWEQSWTHVMRERGCWQTRSTLRERDWPRMPRICSHSLTAPKRETVSLCQPLTTSRYISHKVCLIMWTCETTTTTTTYFCFLRLHKVKCSVITLDCSLICWWL